eukprot:XP_011604887.1 PREDICTED: uncharacterized protein LOC105416825 [Takifugu rubripes]
MKLHRSQRLNPPVTTLCNAARPAQPEQFTVEKTPSPTITQSQQYPAPCQGGKELCTTEDCGPPARQREARLPRHMSMHSAGVLISPFEEGVAWLQPIWAVRPTEPVPERACCLAAPRRLVLPPAILPSRALCRKGVRASWHWAGAAGHGGDPIPGKPQCDHSHCPPTRQSHQGSMDLPCHDNPPPPPIRTKNDLKHISTIWRTV